MSQVIHLKSIAALQKRVKKDMKTLEKHVIEAIHKVCKDGSKRIANEKIPIAFGELRDSIEFSFQTRGGKIIASAPHAAAVEAGSRPHWVPIAALIEWVKLRGAQGLELFKTNGRISHGKKAKKIRSTGTTTTKHAVSVAWELARYESNSGSSPINAPERVARAIQYAIAKKGTRPHRFMENSLTMLFSMLINEIEEALEKDL